MPPSGSVACFRTPVAKSEYGRRSRSATMRETASISRSRRLVDDEPAACDARDELDGAVVVRRAEPTGDEAEVRLEALRERALEIGGAVADDRDPLGLEPEADAPRRRGTARCGPAGRRGPARCR